ncbi:MAG: hypothetical protein WAN33_10060 [Candidatus Acidiferrales bacterium]
MTGRRYYLTTLAAWQRHAPHCAETHFVVLSVPQEKGTTSTLRGPVPVPKERTSPDDAALVFALITADEAAHIALENDVETEPLPHPLARTPISERVAGALAPFGVVSGDDTFTAAEKLAHVNPLLRHRVF